MAVCGGDTAEPGGGALPWLAVTPALPDVQTVRDRLVAAGWLEKSKSRRQSKVVRDDGVVAVCLPVVYGVTEAQLLEHGFSNVMHQEPPPSAEAMSRGKQSPAARLTSAVSDLLDKSGVSREDAETLLSQLPRRWEQHGDLILLPKAAMAGEQWVQLGPALWDVVAAALNVTKVGRKADVDQGPKRESRVELLRGHDGWVQHVDNGITYTYDATLCMFSAGNITEKLRAAKLGQPTEVVVDLYAGIGYFTLPFLVKAGVAQVYACEWNPHAAHALRRNLELNGVAARCIVLEGDNVEMSPRDIADRVSLGLIPTSERGWAVGCAALRPDKGGWLHIHDNIEVPKGEDQVGVFTRRERQVEATLVELNEAARGQVWVARCSHMERVKSYAPRVFHVVMDIEFRPQLSV